MRRPSGVPLGAEPPGCRYPERIAHIARQLSWLTPLVVMTLEDQRILGLVNAAGRPMHSGDLEDGDGGSEGGSEAESGEPEAVSPDAGGAGLALQA